MKDLKFKEIEITKIHSFGIQVKVDGEFISIEKYYIAEFWVRYGGSFIKNIGMALHSADMKNTVKILEGWEDNIEVKNILHTFKEDILGK